MMLHRLAQIHRRDPWRIRKFCMVIGGIEWLCLLLFAIFCPAAHAGPAPAAQNPHPTVLAPKVVADTNRAPAVQILPASSQHAKHTMTKRKHRLHHPVRAVMPHAPKDSDPRGQIQIANAAARMQPLLADYVNAIQHYPYSDGALFQVYTAPGQVTDLALQEGEQLVGTGAVAAGDTVRWIIGDTESGSGTAKRIHVLVKPTRADIGTNLIINTDRRTYHLELRATPATYMASVSWSYPQDQLIALKAAQVEVQRVVPVTAGLDLAMLNFHYRIEGDKAPWRPLRVFDDGRQVMIEFADGIATGEMPPLFVIGSDGSAELVNYRVQNRYMVVDRLFNAAELRLGTKKSQQVVRITRENAAKGKRS